jgi:glycosyltransferase involved in cell wall biosynthesis
MRRNGSLIARDIINQKKVEQEEKARVERIKKMTKKKCTIIIPVYNQKELVIRALDSIPKRNDIEIIVIDDGSDDGTWDNLIQYTEEHPENLILLYNQTNMGVAYTVNKGYDNAKGEYVVLLGSDDYFITEEFNRALNKLDGTDLIYFNLQINNGDIFELTEETKRKYCGSVKFMRREFIGNTRCPEDKKAGEDWYFYEELLKKNPTEKFTGITLKRYNFPRINSLSYLAVKGEL